MASRRLPVPNNTSSSPAAPLLSTLQSIRQGHSSTVPSCRSCPVVPLRLQSRTFSTDQACADALSLEWSWTAKHTDARDVEYPAPPTFITRVDNPRHALA